MTTWSTKDFNSKTNATGGGSAKIEKFSPNVTIKAEIKSPIDATLYSGEIQATAPNGDKISSHSFTNLPVNTWTTDYAFKTETSGDTIFVLTYTTSPPLPNTQVTVSVAYHT